MNSNPTHGRTWAIALIPLFLASVAGIVTFAAMQRDLANLKEKHDAHEEEAAHGEVASRLTALETRLRSFEASLDTVHRSNDRIYDRLWMLENPHRDNP